MGLSSGVPSNHLYFLDSRVQHNVVKGKGGVIDIQTGAEPGVVRDKGHLVIVSNVIR